jgi:hypothetical protein
VFEPVVVVGERLPGVEGRVDVDLLDLSAIGAPIFGDLGEDAKDIEGVAGEEQVVRVGVGPVDVADGSN